MAGRRSHSEKSNRREQGEKQVRGFARGHGAHHRHQAGKEAPRNIGTGRDPMDMPVAALLDDLTVHWAA